MRVNTRRTRRAMYSLENGRQIQRRRCNQRRRRRVQMRVGHVFPKETFGDGIIVGLVEGRVRLAFESQQLDMVSVRRAD